MFDLGVCSQGQPSNWAAHQAQGKQIRQLVPGQRRHLHLLDSSSRCWCRGQCGLSVAIRFTDELAVSRSSSGPINTAFGRHNGSSTGALVSLCGLISPGYTRRSPSKTENCSLSCGKIERYRAAVALFILCLRVTCIGLPSCVATCKPFHPPFPCLLVSSLRQEYSHIFSHTHILTRLLLSRSILAKNLLTPYLARRIVCIVITN